MKKSKTNGNRKFIAVFALLSLFLLLNHQGFAQFQNVCPDTTLIRQGFGCDTSNLKDSYQPVCSCDKKTTYFNQCAALNYGGVTNPDQGPCEAFGFVLWPVPCNTSLNIVLAVKQLSTIVHVTIYGVANYQFCYENYYDLSSFPSGVNSYQIDVSTFPRGVYLVLAQTLDGSYHTYRRFVQLPVIKQ